MNKSKTIELPNIGPVLFEQSIKAKHINISVKPPSTIRVAIPRGISFKKAATFTSTKESWIIKTLHKVKIRSKKQKQIKPVNREHAKTYLLARLDELAIKYGFKYNKVTIRNQKTRWGSCSGNNNINLNMQLINILPKLINYVILHELVHTKIKNHSPLFWGSLDRYVGNAKAIDKELKKYSLS